MQRLRGKSAVPTHVDRVLEQQLRGQSLQDVEIFARPAGIAPLVLEFELEQTVDAAHRRTPAKLAREKANRLAGVAGFALDVGQPKGHAGPPVAMHQLREILIQRAGSSEGAERTVQPADRLGQEIGILLFHPLQRVDRALMFPTIGVDVRLQQARTYAPGVQVVCLPEVPECAVRVSFVAVPAGLLAAVVGDDPSELVPGGLFELAGTGYRLRPVLLLLVDVD